MGRDHVITVAEVEGHDITVLYYDGDPVISLRQHYVDVLGEALALRVDQQIMELFNA